MKTARSYFYVENLRKESPMPETVQHQDFGEKIGGAKKDLWNERGLYSSDISSMNEREAAKYVKKDNVWKKNDYQAMIDGGTPFDVVYFIKKVRDNLADAPVFLRLDDTEEKRLDRQKQYIDTVRELESVMLSVRTKEDALATLERFFVDNGYMEVAAHSGIQTYKQFRYTEKGRGNPVISDKLFKTMNVSSNRFDYDITRKAEREQFGTPKKNKVPRGYEIRFNDKTMKHSGDEWKPDTWYVTKGHYILKMNFESKEEALKWAQGAANRQTSDRKKRFIPPQLENIKRDGPDYRQGMDIEGQDYLDTFGFKGGEFGNWMSQKDRQASLDFGFEALKDLADALQISDMDVSYNGALSIAFGARGSGNAVAHYEPLRNVINLTKMRGAGSLAHEWWHGLDDYMGSKLGVCGLLSDHAHKSPAFNKLMEVIKSKPETPEQAAERTVKQNERMRKNADSWLKSDVSSQLQNNESILPEYEKLREGFLRGEAGNIAKINELQKSVVGRVIPKEARERLENFERWLGQAVSTPPAIGKTATDYLRNSKEMGQIFEKEGDYWESNVELTARAFATYVMDKLGRRSDYLIGHAECAVNIVTDKSGEMQILKAYPQGEERTAINRAFDDVVAELKREQYLTHDERRPPESQYVPEPARVSSHSTVFDNDRIDSGEQCSFNDLFYSQGCGEDQDEDLEM
jgi:hypothetical protein